MQRTPCISWAFKWLHTCTCKSQLFWLHLTLCNNIEICNWEHFQPCLYPACHNGCISTPNCHICTAAAQKGKVNKLKLHMQMFLIWTSYTIHGAMFCICEGLFLSHDTHPVFLCLVYSSKLHKFLYRYINHIKMWMNMIFSL